DVKALEIEIPALTAGYKTLPKLEGLTIEDIKKEFSSKYEPLPLGSRGVENIEYEGRHLFTGEIVEKMSIHLPLLEFGMGAVSYYVKQLEQVCKLRGLHPILAPLVQTFLEEVLFTGKSNLFDPSLVSRLGDSDVAEHIRAVFVPLIRQRTITDEERLAAGESLYMSEWKPYQVTHSERRPALEAQRTLFNLVPCNRSLEVALTNFAERAKDVAAFAKNGGPQCLRIDYLAGGGRLAFYTPDFFIRTASGNYYLVETKGREDVDVPRKARAAIEWCKSASGENRTWEYLYVPEGIFERHRGDTIEELARSCAPALQNLIRTEETEQKLPLIAMIEKGEEEATAPTEFVDEELLQMLPSRYQDAVKQSVMLFKFFENKKGMNYAPVFTALLGSLDEASRGLISRRLLTHLPRTSAEQKAWFDPYLVGVDPRMLKHYQSMAQNLKRTLVFKNGLSPVGLLRSCLDYALNDREDLTGVFSAVRSEFKVAGARDLLARVNAINDFRNTYIAHHEKELTDMYLARLELRRWIEGLSIIHSFGQ
ncbi:MAG TPA: restriction endonuclease subunit R, partial [Thermodesulfobacteriota bacterium]|nr:restriction endonuclease subunit R [Thermodesulfobacteriota bacterium]